VRLGSGASGAQAVSSKAINPASFLIPRIIPALHSPALMRGKRGTINTSVINKNLSQQMGYAKLMLCLMRN
jgi:hypothetical protein